VTDVDPELIFRVIMEVADLESQIEAVEFGMVTRGAVAESGAGGRYLPAANETIVKGVGIYPPNPTMPLVRNAPAHADWHRGTESARGAGQSG
jgi:hypothetical protein